MWPPTYLQVFLIVALPLMGVVYALLGGIKLPLAERLGLDEGKVGGLVSGFGLMVGPTILVCGFLTDAVGRKSVFLTGAVMVVLAILIFATTRSFKGALVAVLLLGAGWSATINVGNVLMRVSVADPKRLVQAVNFFDCIFGLGAFVTPMLLGALFKRLRYSGALMAVAVLSAVPIVMGAAAEMNPGPAASAAAGAAEGEGLRVLLTSAAFWIPALAFLFYAPLETSVAGWATTLVTRQAPEGDEKTRKLGAVALFRFWLCFTGSRLLVALFAHDVQPQSMLLVMSLISLALMIGITMLRGPQMAATHVILAGLAFGPVFPTLMSVLLSSVPPSTMGRAVGFFFAFASVGWTVIPMLIGAVTNRTNIQRGFVVAAASAAIFVSLVVVRGIWAR